MEIKFKATIRRSNDVHVITIPAQYMKDGMLWSGEQMQVSIDNGE